MWHKIIFDLVSSKRFISKFFFSGLIFLTLSQTVVAQTQYTPTSYSYNTGPSGSYPDNSPPSELTDGTKSVTVWPNTANSASLAGWNNANPSIKFIFSSGAVQINQINVWVADSDGSAGVGVPSSVTISAGGTSKTINVSNPAGSGTTVSLNLTGFFLYDDTISLTVNGNYPTYVWTMLSEVEFYGPSSGPFSITGTTDFFSDYTGNQISQQFTGTGSINVLGSGKLNLSGSNTYSGNTTLPSQSYLRISSATALGTGSISVNGTNSGNGSTFDINGNTISNNITTQYLNSGQTAAGLGCIQNTNTSTTAVLNGNWTLGGNNYVGGNGNLTLNGLISGGVSNSYSLYKQGTGIWKFTNDNNTFDGFYYQIGGITEFTSIGNLNQNSSLGKPTTATGNQVAFGFASAGGGTLRFVGSSANSSDRTYTILGSTAVTNKIEADGTTSAATLTLTGNLSPAVVGSHNFALGGNNTGINTYSGVIGNGSGNLSLIKEGTTTWRLTGSNTYSGSTTISSGTLQIGSGSTTGTLGSGNVINNSTLSINRSNDYTLSNNISGSGAVTQEGASSTTLSGTNTFTGATTVTAGTLVASTSLASSSSLSVAAGATIKGTGTLPPSTINGTHAPGNSPGVQAVSGNLTYNAGSSISWELISNSIGTRGTDYDGINVTGNLNFSGATTLNLTFNAAGSAVDWTNAFWNTAKTGSNGWKIFDVTGTTSNLSNLSINVINWLDGQNISIATARAGYTITFDLYQNGNDVYLTYDIVSINANLSNLTVNPSALSPAFNSNTTSYSNPVASNVTTAIITATVSDANASMTVNSQVVTSGSPFTINLTGGQNIVDIVVTAADGITTKTYTVDVSIPINASETVVSFKNTGTTTWTAPPGVHKVQALVVGGGGGGAGRDIGGGGGAGGLVFNTGFSVTPGSTYSVTVGAGGAGGTDPDNSRNGKLGGNSSFSTITALGGGGGKGWSVTNNTNNGGSGGGGSGDGSYLTAGTGTSGQGFAGGNGGSGTDYGGGGGGGASQVGFASSAANRGKGGNGLSSVTISSVTYNFMNLFGTTHGGHVVGSDLYFAGGGGGSGHRTSAPMHSGAGGLGGGGAVPGTTGSANPSGNGGAGTVNTGGGGGASRNTGTSGGAGGSGVVIIRYSVLTVGQNGPDQIIGNSETSGIVGLRKIDSNTVELSGDSDFSGVSVESGTLLVGNNGTIGAIGTGNVIVASGAFFGINRSDNIDFTNAISGGGGFIQKGDGKTTFSNAKTYTGPTEVEVGTLEFSTTGTTALGSSIQISDGGTILLSRNDTWGTISAISSPSIALNSGGTLSSNNTFTAINGLTFNGGALTTNGGNTAINPAFALKGITTVTGAGSQINSTGAGTHNTVAIGSGSAGGTAVFNVSDGASYGDLSVNVPFINLGGSSSSLTKNGTGLLSLNASNTYSGNTIINEGTLEVNGSLTSPIANMAAAATLGGNGTVSTVSLRGTVTPGSGGAGKLITGNVTLSGNTAYSFDLESAVGAAGVEWDLLQVNGTLALGSHQLVVNLSGSPSDFSFLQEYSWKIVGATSITGFNAANWTVNPIEFNAYTGNALWKIELVGNDIFLKFEPKSIIWPGVGNVNGVDLTEVFDNITITAGKTLTVEIGAPLDYLVVAGGGSGAGRDVGGGGGGGGVLSNLTHPNPNFIYLGAGTYTVTVGAGGIGTNNNDGVSGGNSMFGTFKAIGGGGGGYYASYTAPLGGSGGGGGRQGYFGGPGVKGQGFSGGNGSNGSTSLYDAGGGGGGAGGIGQTAVKGTLSTTGKGGDGGPGVQINFTGTPSYFGGGGGGAPHRSSSLSTMISGVGGIGGGGNAAVNNNSAPQAGQPNTGGGGGASRSTTGSLIIGGNGGSGIVQVRYPAPAFASGGNIISGTGTAIDFTIHNFTQIGASTFTIPEDGLKTTYFGVLDGPGNFEFNSPGTLVIANNQLLTGTSSILQGNLEVNANLTSSSSLVVASSATLSGTGTLPTTTVYGTHNPGTSPGVQTVDGDMLYKTGSLINWELAANGTTSRGINYDGVNVNGNLTFEPNTTLNLVFNSVGSNVDWTDPFWKISSSGVSSSWKLFELTSGSIQGENNIVLPSMSTLLDKNGVSLTSALPNVQGFRLVKENNTLYLEFISANLWTGASNTNESIVGNWSLGRAPISGEGVVIASNAVNDLILSSHKTYRYVDFNSSNKKVILGNFNLTVEKVILGANSTNYIQTNGTGKLKRSCALNTYTRFDVGRSAYNPVEIRPSIVDEYAVLVKDIVENNSNLSSTFVNRMWDISRSLSQVSGTVDFIYQWNANEVINGPFITPKLNHYNGSNWEFASGNTSSPASPILTVTHTGYTGTFSPFAISDASTPLPVEFLGMQTECIDNVGVRITWQTASEFNAMHFELLRSSDGLDWKIIDTMVANGTTTQLSSYTILDEERLNESLRYYKLKQVDIDGKFEMLPVISANCESDFNQLHVYPNPADDVLFIDFEYDKQCEIELYVTDALGREVSKKRVFVKEGLNKIVVEMNDFSNGIYRIQINDELIKQPIQVLINR